MADPTWDEIAQAMAGAGVQDPNAPIGISADYRPPLLGGYGRFESGTGAAPTFDDLNRNPYRPGAELAPASMSPESIVGLQQQLVDAGLLRGTFRVGVWDSASTSAYRSLLSYANQLGTTDAFALERWVSTGMGEYDPTPTERAPFVAEVSHPDDVKAALRDTFREKVGFGKIDEDRLDAMVRAWQGEEVGAQRAEYDMAANPAGGTVTAPREFSVFAEEQARKANPVGFSAHTYLDKFSAIAGMLGGQNG